MEKAKEEFFLINGVLYHNDLKTRVDPSEIDEGKSYDICIMTKNEPIPVCILDEEGGGNANAKG